MKTVLQLACLGAALLLFANLLIRSWSLPSTATPYSQVLYHGPMKKHGPVAILTQLESLQYGRSFSNEWIQGRLEGNATDPPPFCPILFNDKYKIIYTKSPKTAGSTLMTYFTTCTDLRPADWCLKYFDAQNATEAKHLLDVWGEYYVFSFARNVLQRSISQHQYLGSFMHDHCSVTWDAFCQDPSLLGDVCARSPACCDQSAEHQYLHVIPQSNCLFTQAGETAVNFLGRVEAFEQDFEVLIDTLNARDLPALPKYVPKKMNYNESPCQSRRRLLYNVTSEENPCDKSEFFQSSHAHCYASIGRLFAKDMLFLHGQ